MTNQRMKLSELRDGQLAVIEAYPSNVSSGVTDTLDTINPRYGELGFFAGAQITRICAAPWFADPIVFQVNQTRISLRKSECDQFFVRLLA